MFHAIFSLNELQKYDKNGSSQPEGGRSYQPGGVGKCGNVEMWRWKDRGTETKETKGTTGLTRTRGGGQNDGRTWGRGDGEIEKARVKSRQGRPIL